MADTTSLKKDVFIIFKDAVYQVVDFQHVNPGKGSAFIRTKLRNVQSGKVLDNTFKAGEAIELAELERKTVQYLYRDDSGFHFMDNETFEQLGISAELIGDKGGYLTEGQEVIVLFHEGSPLSVDLPKKLTLKVTEAMPAVKGDTASGNVKKEVTLETGMKIDVPLFIEQGDEVIINTESGLYVERAK
ncbi:elongation factor P [Parcubacteria bacterium SG8_24]|nr:MAG: elongation factor P [Parcubacteria bacterium SG8_24]